MFVKCLDEFSSRQNLPRILFMKNLLWSNCRIRFGTTENRFQNNFHSTMLMNTMASKMVNHQRNSLADDEWQFLFVCANNKRLVHLRIKFHLFSSQRFSFCFYLRNVPSRFSLFDLRRSEMKKRKSKSINFSSLFFSATNVVQYFHRQLNSAVRWFGWWWNILIETQISKFNSTISVLIFVQITYAWNWQSLTISNEEEEEEEERRND